MTGSSAERKTSTSRSEATIIRVDRFFSARDRGRVARLLVVGLLLIGWVCDAARAHDPFASWTLGVVRPEGVELELVLARSAALRLLDEWETLPPISPSNMETYRPRLLERAAGLYTLTGGGAPIALRRATVELTVEDDVQFNLAYDAPEAGPLLFRATYLHKMQEEHVGTIEISDAAKKNLGWKEITTEHPTMELKLTLNPGTTRPVATADDQSFFLRFLKLGVEHILTGYDHLLFLLGLLVVCDRFRSMAKIITCFTVAHSITLALSALDLASIPGRIVEPCIAASIVYVGIENVVMREREPRFRWLLTFAFGLIHGFGFASVLREVGLGHGREMVVSLFSFNLGVEIGQIAVASIVLPLLWLLWKKVPLYKHYGRGTISVIVTVLGAYWLVTRVLGIG